MWSEDYSPYLVFVNIQLVVELTLAELSQKEQISAAQCAEFVLKAQ